MVERIKRSFYKKGDKRNRREKDDGHITVLSEPGLEYLSQLTHSTGHVEEIIINK